MIKLWIVTGLVLAWLVVTITITDAKQPPPPGTKTVMPTGTWITKPTATPTPIRLTPPVPTAAPTPVAYIYLPVVSRGCPECITKGREQR